MHADMETPRRVPLKPLAIKLLAVVLAKFALLTLAWWIAASRHPPPDTGPAAMQRLLAPSQDSASAHPSPHGG
jgi:hypothetical protein